MTTKDLYEFINTKLNTLGAFDSSYLLAYDGDDLANIIDNMTTLQQETINYTPFSVISYESEVQPLEELGIYQYTIPMEFAVRYANKDTVPALIEAFVELLNGKGFTIGDKWVVWGATGISPIGTDELNAGDWVQVTLTLFAYSSLTYTGNHITYTLNGVIVHPLSYAVSMDNQMEVYAPQDKTTVTSQSNAKQHLRNLLLFYPIGGADTWAKECELDIINTDYTLAITYPSFTLSTSVKLKSGTGTLVNGTSIMYNLVFINA